MTPPDCPRSNCPITGALDLLGDRWTLVIMRDLLLAGRRHFSDLAGPEGIATNVLTERLDRLEKAGVVLKEVDPDDRRRRIYTVTERGKELLPVMVELVVWGSAHVPHGTAHAELAERARTDRDGLLRDLRAAIEAREG